MDTVVRKPWRFVGLSFAVGLLSLGQEIVWVRLVSFMLQSIPQAFSLVLFFFIVGIAFGALSASALLKQAFDPDRVVAVLLLLSGAIVCAAPWLLTWQAQAATPLAIGLLILLTAGFKGAIFPLVHHFFSQAGTSLGRTLSFVYCANVLGSTLGPLLVGFILLDHLSAHTVLFGPGVVELLLALWFIGLRMPVRALVAVALLLAAWPLWLQSQQLLMRSIAASHDGKRLTHLIENRHGVIYTMGDSRYGVDRVYGGNVYDGAVNVDIRNPVNGIDRVYLLSALQPAPRRVAVIGLSVGSWLRVVQAFPGIERIDVVEINPGYVELSKAYPGYSDYLRDPRVHLHFTDGRKWLSRQVEAGQRYDLILMNTTWHWRIYSSNLLSQEFLGVIRQALNSNGIVALNATDSIDAFYTVAQTFPYAYKYSKFIYAAEHDLKLARTHGMEKFCRLDFARLGLAGCQDADQVEAAGKMLQGPMLSWDEFMLQDDLQRAPELVTDDNMLTEYRWGRKLF